MKEISGLNSKFCACSLFAKRQALMMNKGVQIPVSFFESQTNSTEDIKSFSEKSMRVFY